jgi:general secretion pathway protein G
MTPRNCPNCGQEVSPAAVVCSHCSHPLDAVAQADKRRSPALWLLAIAGCGLVVLFVGGIVAAIFIPNFLEALQRAKQKRTMVDLRTWGAVLEGYRLDHDGSVPAVGSVEELAGALDLDAAEIPPTTDGWQHPLRYACWSIEGEGGGCDTYRMASAGRDGVFEAEDLAVYAPGTFGLTDYDGDLVVQDGAFVRYPGPAR